MIAISRTAIESNTANTTALPLTLDDICNEVNSIGKHEAPAVKYPPIFDKALPPGLDPHLEKEDIIFFYKLNKTLIKNKMEPESNAYDCDFPSPIYTSPRKPVWLLSEMIVWQEKLKEKRSLLKNRGASDEK